MNLPLTLELISAFCGLLYIVLARFQKATAWLFWFVSSVCYFIVFWHAELFGQSLLQVFFVVSAVYGYRSWRGSHSDNRYVAETLRIQALPPKSLVMLSVGGVFATLILGAFIFRQTQALSAFVDGGIVAFSILATLLAVKKFIECWKFWIAVNTVATVFFVTEGLFATAFLYLVYLAFAVWALRGWQQSLDWS